MVDDDGSGTTGTVLNNAWKQELYDQIDAAAGGAWIDVPYNAANFTADGATWTVLAGDQRTYAYVLNGKTMTLAISLVGSTLSASSAGLHIAIPGGRQVARNHHAMFRYTDNLQKDKGCLAYVFPGDLTHVGFQAMDYATGAIIPFAAGAVVLQGTIIFTVL